MKHIPESIADFLGDNYIVTPANTKNILHIITTYYDKLIRKDISLEIISSIKNDLDEDTTHMMLSNNGIVIEYEPKQNNTYKKHWAIQFELYQDNKKYITIPKDIILDSDMIIKNK